MISIGGKLFEETDTPTESKIVDEDKVNKTNSKTKQLDWELEALTLFLAERCQVQVHLS